jgi:hypothetical protein
MSERDKCRIAWLKEYTPKYIGRPLSDEELQSMGRTAWDACWKRHVAPMEKQIDRLIKQLEATKAELKEVSSNIK